MEVILLRGIILLYIYGRWELFRNGYGYLIFISIWCES